MRACSVSGFLFLFVFKRNSSVSRLPAKGNVKVLLPTHLAVCSWRMLTPVCKWKQRQPGWRAGSRVGAGLAAQMPRSCLFARQTRNRDNSQPLPSRGDSWVSTRATTWLLLAHQPAKSPLLHLLGITSQFQVSQHFP